MNVENYVGRNRVYVCNFEEIDFDFTTKPAASTCSRSRSSQGVVNLASTMSEDDPYVDPFGLAFLPP